MRCICHSAHLCASHACKKLPRTAEELMHDVYNYFSNSPKHQEQFRVVQHFCNVALHKLLHPCQTRWLSLSRLIEQWDALIIFFKTVAGHDKLLISILLLLQNPIWKLYSHFLELVLPEFTEVNVMFQSSKLSVHCLLNGLSAVYIEMLSYYLNEAYWKGLPLKDIDPASKVNFMPWSKMYMRMYIYIEAASCIFTLKLLLK